MVGFSGGCTAANGTHTLVRTPADDDNTYTATAGHLTITMVTDNCASGVITVSGGCLDTGAGYDPRSFTKSCCIECWVPTGSGVTINMIPKVAGNFLNEIEVTIADVVPCGDCIDTLCAGQPYLGNRNTDIVFTGLNGTHTLTYDADLSGPSWPALGTCVWSAYIGNVAFNSWPLSVTDCDTGDSSAVSSTIRLTARTSAGYVGFFIDGTSGYKSQIFAKSQAKVAGEGHCSDTLGTIGTLSNGIGACCRDTLNPIIGAGGTADITWSP